MVPPQLTAFFARPEMTRLLQKLTGGYGFESAAEAARILLARYDVNKDKVLDKKEADALKAGALRGARTNNCLADDLPLPLCPVYVCARVCACGPELGQCIANPFFVFMTAPVVTPGNG